MLLVGRSVEILLAQEFQDLIRDFQVVQIGEHEVCVSADADLRKMDKFGISSVFVDSLYPQLGHGLRREP